MSWEPRLYSRDWAETEVRKRINQAAATAVLHEMPDYKGLAASKEERAAFRAAVGQRVQPYIESGNLEEDIYQCRYEAVASEAAHWLVLWEVAKKKRGQRTTRPDFLVWRAYWTFRANGIAFSEEVLRALDSITDLGASRPAVHLSQRLQAKADALELVSAFVAFGAQRGLAIKYAANATGMTEGALRNLRSKEKAPGRRAYGTRTKPVRQNMQQSSPDPFRYSPTWSAPEKP